MNRYRSGALALGVPPAKIWLPCSVSRLKLNPSPKAPRPTLSATHPWFKPPPPEAPYCQLQCRNAPANVQTADRGHAACGMTTVHDPNPLGLTILCFDLLEESPQGALITGIAGKHFISQRKTFWCHNQSDDHLYTIRSLVTTVTKLALIIFSKGWLAFEISTG